MIKLIIQIPCFNERESLPKTIADLPRKIFGVDKVEWLFIDDGSTDGTFEYLSSLNEGHIVRLEKNQGLAKAFSIGLRTALAKGADIIVNTDADNQYKGQDIQRLIAPILNGQSDISIGKRNINSIEDFSTSKKVFQKIGSFYMRKITGLSISDAPSGFRAFSRKAAAEIQIYSNYTYTLESLVCAAHKKMRVTEVPITVNKELRPSRLIAHNGQYIWNAIATTVLVKILYSPVKTILTLGLLVLFFIAAIHFALPTNESVDTELKALALLGLGISTIFIFFAAVIANMITVNRQILESIQTKISDAYLQPAQNTEVHSASGKVIKLHKD